MVDKAGELMAGTRRLSDRELTRITAMLNGTSVELTRQKPLGLRDLTETGRADLTLAAAVREMKRAFASVADVVAAAESVWNETADGLSEIGTWKLAAAKDQLGDLGDDEVTSALDSAADELGQLRDVLNSDPLALWHGDGVDTTRLDWLRERSAAAATRAAEIARLRADAQQRISAAALAVAAVTAAREDAASARARAEAKIAVADLQPSRATAMGLEARLAVLDRLKAAGRWTRLAAELDTIEAEAAAVELDRAAERAAVTLLGRRDELARPAGRLPGRGGTAGSCRGHRTHGALPAGLRPAVGGTV